MVDSRWTDVVVRRSGKYYGSISNYLKYFDEFGREYFYAKHGVRNAEEMAFKISGLFLYRAGLSQIDGHPIAQVLQEFLLHCFVQEANFLGLTHKKFGIRS